MQEENNLGSKKDLTVDLGVDMDGDLIDDSLKRYMGVTDDDYVVGEQSPDIPTETLRGSSPWLLKSLLQESG